MKQTEVDCLVCPSCKQVIKLDLEVPPDVDFPTKMTSCPRCGVGFPRFVKDLWKNPTYSLAYACGPARLWIPVPRFAEIRYGDLLFIISSEIYQMLRSGRNSSHWNGFMNFSRLEEVPSVVQISPPPYSGHMLRQDYPVELLYLIATIIVSGIIGNLSYDLLKQLVSRVWKKMQKHQRNVNRQNRHKDEELSPSDIERFTQLAYQYARNRLANLNLVQRPDGMICKILSHFKKRRFWRSTDLAKSLGLSLTETRTLLKLIGAVYVKSGKHRFFWVLPLVEEEGLKYYRWQEETSPT